MMIANGQILRLEKAEYAGKYKLKLTFNDGTARIVDFYPFLSASLNPLIRNYLDRQEFLKFNIDDGDLEWNDYDLCFPIADLYENTISPRPVTRRWRHSSEAVGG